MPTIDVMPMTTPRTVSAERILLVRSVSQDIVTISRSRPVLICAINRSAFLNQRQPLLKRSQEKGEGRREDPFVENQKKFSFLLSPVDLLSHECSVTVKAVD